MITYVILMLTPFKKCSILKSRFVTCQNFDIFYFRTLLILTCDTFSNIKLSKFLYTKDSYFDPWKT